MKYLGGAVRAMMLATCMAAATAQDSPTRLQGPARVSGGVMAGQILSKAAPVYPAEAKANHISGAVVLHAIIGKDGTIENLTAISGPEMLLASAIEAVRQWIYKPYLLNGQPTEVDTTITVTYSFGADPGSSPVSPFGG